ncbi:DEAD/DEAH box helicase [Pacificibacter marinus]|uniref:Ski2-like helicase n=1 Tax=Pacificibacter marinus TaxID=658057 RepID=A0A1Y5RLU7_9RHOB|nr:DEAD/DEAH box helicase [Pacificibacter marinus]SEK17495.1 Helicase conserved C-terminal domain-containing protein [Pacificibacter marinus]SLN20482.1 ski2-like helicase [Pacificibacter marinus]
MFDESSRRLIRTAPNLPGLEADMLDEVLTEAHIELATIRVEIFGEDEVRRSILLDKVRRLAATFEAYVALDLQPARTQAAAFVAASAHQLIARATNGRAVGPTLLSSDAVSSTIASTLLFLIADRAADAAEAASKLIAKGEDHAIRRALIISIRELAKGELSKISERALEGESIAADDSRQHATNLLFRECALVVQGLAVEALGKSEIVEDLEQKLVQVISLAEPRDNELPEGIAGLMHEQYAGPHHVATLLLRLLPRVRQSMLIRTPVPVGANSTTWREWLLPQAEKRPFLWTNHLHAVATGYLDRGSSMVMTTPTGSGKTTLSVLKIAAVLCADESVVYLAPTHALVDQVEYDLSGEVGDIDPESVEDTLLEEIGDRLPQLSVMTPERCLALLSSAPELFENVGLLVFDEFHLISADDPKTSPKINSRAIDAMLALLSFMSFRRNADLLLLSAMVANGEEIKNWLHSTTGQTVHCFNDPWKPTRQLRSCVVYDDAEVRSSAAETATLPTKKEQNAIPVQPFGLFSLLSGWHPDRPEKLAVRRLTAATPALTRKPNGRHTSNRNAVAAQVAADYAAQGKRVVVFCTDATACGSIADAINEQLDIADITLTDDQESMRKSILKDIGSSDAAYEPTGLRAGVHHGDLMPLERRLMETVFRTGRPTSGPTHGLEVIAATSTIAQGLNLPCDVVVLAGTDRSVQDDPGGNPRKDLLPHEILNAMGRAGRAAYSATGLAIVVPANPIRVDTSALAFGQDQNPLDIVFSDNDACQDIIDPVELLLDTIEATASSDPKAQAMIRRLSSVTNDGRSGFDDIAGRSFGYFVRKAREGTSADAWLQSRRIALTAATETLQDPPVLPWQQTLAVRNGVPPELIARIVSQMGSAPIDKAETSDWVSWLLDVCVTSSADLTLLVRETSLNTVFGRAFTNQADKDAGSQIILGALKSLVEMWCGGKSLVEIQTWLLAFVRQHEQPVLQQTSAQKHANRARRFSIRILPDIGFLCSLLSQIVKAMELETGIPPSPIIEMLQQMVKAGDFNRHHAWLRRETNNTSRVGSYEELKTIEDGFSADANADLDTVHNEVRVALAIRMFSSIDDL